METHFASSVAEMSPAEHARLTDRLRAEGLSGAHLEIGTARGGTLATLMRLYPPPRPAFYVVDTMRYFDGQLEAVRETLRRSGLDPDEPTFWIGASEALYGREDTREVAFDFVFVDARHTAYHVLLDAQWANQLRVGGLLCFHDCSADFPGVDWAIEHFRARAFGYEPLERIDTLAVFRKTEPSRFSPSLASRARAKWRDFRIRADRRRAKRRAPAPA